MKKTPIVCEDVAPAFPPYPVAVRAGELLFVSGLRPAGPAGFADLPEEGRGQMQGYPLADLTEERVVADSWAVHDSLEKILVAAGTNRDQVLRQHIWQRDKRYFPSYEHVRVHWQPTPAPSSGLGITDVVGCGRHWIGVDAIAACTQAGGVFGERQVMTDVYNPDLPAASHYCQAIRSGPFAFLPVTFRSRQQNPANRWSTLMTTCQRRVVSSRRDAAIPTAGTALSHPKPGMYTTNCAAHSRATAWIWKTS